MKLHILAKPSAKVSEVLGWEMHPHFGKVLKVKIAAPPMDGAANKELIHLLSKTLGISKASIELAKGDSSRIKTIFLPDSVSLEKLPLA